MNASNYIKPKHSKIGDYRISDPLLDDSSLSVLDLTIDALSSKIIGLRETLQQLSVSVLTNHIANVEILRPEDAAELYLRIDVFDSPEMSAELGAIDLSSSENWKYFEALAVSNSEAGEQPEQPSGFRLSPYFQQTQWISPADLDAAMRDYGIDTGFRGYGPAFNNSPVNVYFPEWLNDSGLSSGLDASSRFYLRFHWYYVDRDESGNVSAVHASDHFSMAVPGYSEVGAKAGAAAGVKQIYELRQMIEIDTTVADYDENAGYRVNPYQCATLRDFETCDDRTIVLQDYTPGKTYKFKFSTGDDPVAVSCVNGRNGTIQFKCDMGNGPQNVDELSSSDTVFEARKTYLA